MSETRRRHAEGRRWAIGIGFLGAVFALSQTAGAGTVSERQARAEAAVFLEASPQSADLDPEGAHWVVQSEQERATIDAKTGELVEIEFAIDEG